MGSITVSNLGKAYKQYPTRWGRLAEWLLPGSKPRHNLKWVMQEINFSVSSGEAVGIIGINGAGKSTLLRALLEKRVIPYFSDAHGDGMYARSIGENWFRYCAAPTVCVGRETYYWALFEVPAHQLGQPVVPYAQFLRAQAQESLAA